MENTEETKVAEQATEKKKRYSDYDWPVYNEGWFSDPVSINGRWNGIEFLAVFIGCVILCVLPIPFNWFISIILMLAATAKRLHDLNLTSKWAILALPLFYYGGQALVTMLLYHVTPVLAIYGAFVIAFVVWPGSKGINKYGSNPHRNYDDQCEEIGLPRSSEFTE